MSDVAMQHIQAVKLNDSLYEVIEYMALHDVDLLAVLSDDEKQVVAGVMRKDILKYISKA